MKRSVLLSALMLVSTIAWTLPPQGTDDQTISLGALARQLRAGRADPAKQTVKVFTNDDVSLRPPGEGLTGPSGISSAPAKPVHVQPSAGSAAPPAANEVSDNKYYRAGKVKTKSATVIQRRERAGLQQRLAQNGKLYHSDSNKKLRQELSRSNSNKLKGNAAEPQARALNLRARSVPTEYLRAKHPVWGGARRTTNLSNLKKTVLVVQPPWHEPVLQAVAPPTPVATVLKPIGYVEKPGGLVEAVVLEADQIYVVHEGEVFANRYKVKKISRFAVEVVDVEAERSSVQPAEAKMVAVQLAPASPVRAAAPDSRVKLDKAVDRQPSNLGAAAQLGAVSESERLGYVETSNGQVQSIVADGDLVRLVPEGPTVAPYSKPPDGIALPVEVASVNAEEVPPTARLETTLEGQLEKVAHLPLPLGSIYRLVPLGSDSPVPGSVVGQEATLAESFRLGGLVAREHLAGGEEKMVRAEEPETATGGLKSPPPATETLATIGYVEWASGRVEGVVDEDNEVFLVKVGDFFANRFRAVEVSPTSIVLAEELPRNEIQLPAVTVWELADQFAAGLGLPTGLSHPDDVNPITPLAPDGRVSAQELWLEPRPPDEAVPPVSAVGHALRARQDLQASGTAGVPVTERSGPARSPIKLTPLGYVEKANGEVQAVVVHDDQIYLVQQGDFFAHRFKALSVSASVVVAMDVSPSESDTQTLPGASTKAQLSSAKPVDVPLGFPSGAVQAGTALPEVQSPGKALTGSGTGPLEYEPGVGFHFRSPVNATPNLPR
jgi:hypothetical protein